MTTLTDPRTAPEVTSAARRPAAVVAVLALAGVIAAGTQTLVVPLIGQLPALLGAAPDDTAWAVTATLLVAAIVMPIAGRLGDMLGKRRMLLISLVPLIAGLVLCALSDSLAPMIVGRALQGLGMGVVPLGISLLREAVPPERVGASVALMSASMGIGGALALPFAAAVAEYASWRGMFWAFAALSAATFLLILWVVPSGSGRVRGQRFDVLGALLLAGALVGLLLPVSKGASWGWGSAPTLVLFAAAAVLLLLWILQQLRTPQPLVNLRSLRDPTVTLANVASLLVGFAMYGQSLVLPQLLQLPVATGYGLGQSMLQMALWLLPGGVVMMLVSPIGAKITAARGPKTTLMLGAAGIAAGYGASVLAMGSPLGVMASVMVINVGVGFAYGAIPMLVMGAVSPTETASANSFNTLVRSIGTSAASAVTGVILTASAVGSAGGHVVPSEAGFQLALGVGAGIALLALVVASLLPRPIRRRETAR